MDSKYTPATLNAHTGTDYIFEIESIGETAIEVYSVDSGGVRTLLTSSQYVLVFEEHRDPIYIRGKVILGAPLSAGEQLQIMRKTPISTEFSTTALQPFPSEQFEYTLDQICYIQQEIEGHYCACYDEDEWEDGEPPTPPPGEPEYPECYPYACDALQAEVVKQADLTWSCDELIYISAGEWNVPEFGGGAPLTSSAGSNVELISDPIIPDACYLNSIFVKGAAGTGLEHEIVRATGAVSDSVSIGAVTLSQIVGGSGAGYTIFRYIRGLQNADTSTRFGDIIVTVGLIDVANAPKLRVSATVDGDAVPSEEALLSDYGLTYDEALYCHADISLSFVTSGWSLTGSIQVDVVVNKSSIISMGASKTINRLFPPEGAEDATVEYMAAGPSCYINNAYFNDGMMTPAAISVLGTAWERNQVGYEPPEYCDFGG